MLTLGYLLLALNLVSIREVPAGTLLHLRLTTAVGSFASRAGQPVRAVLIAPVMAGSQTLLPAGSTLSGTVKSVRRVGLGILHETASLKLEFSSVTLPDGERFPLSARVEQVDNSRERVEQDGAIHGVRTTRSLSYRASGYIRTALHWEIHAEAAALLIRALVVQVPEPEIYYPAGVELTLALTDPLVSIPYEPEDRTDEMTEPDRARMTQLVGALPYRTVLPASGRPSDIVNVLFIGSRERLAAAFSAAGWIEANRASLRSDLKGIRAVAEGLGDGSAPMSIQLLNHAPPEMSWEKTLNDFSKRHHIRLWKQPETWDGEEIWIGAATRDIDFAYFRPGHPLTHRIEQNVDSERDKIADDLVFTSCVSMLDWLERPGMQHTAINATGDPIYTNTRLAVMRLNTCLSPRLSAAGGEGGTVAAHGSRVQRFVRREILSVRSDLLRGNPYFRGYEGARLLASAARRRRGAESGPPGRLSHSVSEWLR